MRDDKDLNFLAKIESEQLDSLVQILIQGKNGKNRLTESITKHSLYQEHEPDHHQYWHLICDELQRFGANSIATLVRGNGILYKEVTADVAEKLKIKVDKDDSVQEIENSILIKIITSSLSELDPNELKELVKELDLDTVDFTKQAVALSIQIAVKKSGFIAYQVAAIVANAVTKQLLGHGLRLTTNAAISRGLSFMLGPVGWAITGVWTAADIAGPAYRVTIPAVIQVAFLRAKMNQQNERLMDNKI